MGNKLILEVGSMTLEVGDKITELSPSQFKILYQFFKVVKDRPALSFPKDTIVYYQDIDFSRGAMKVHMVDIKKLLPDGSYENVRGQGYKLNTRWAWELKA